MVTDSRKLGIYGSIDYAGRGALMRLLLNKDTKQLEFPSLVQPVFHFHSFDWPVSCVALQYRCQVRCTFRTPPFLLLKDLVEEVPKKVYA